MKLLGIDYGEKRVGIATSDEGGILAFPKEILDNDKNLVAKIKKICEEEKIEKIVLGESVNDKGELNKIMEKITHFKEELEKEIKLPVYFEKEFMTSLEARRYQENLKRVDASAAALILQRYLDRKKHD
jgi:putative holliday junction resolvase